MNDILSIAQIKESYPDQWVLIGNPLLDDINTAGSIISKIKAGVVLLASKDKKEIGYKAKEKRVGFESVSCIYTGGTLK
jgi:hypothetical protein